MLSQNLKNLRTVFAHYSERMAAGGLDSVALSSQALGQLIAQFDDMAWQARALEARPVPPELRVSESFANVVVLAGRSPRLPERSDA